MPKTFAVYLRQKSIPKWLPVLGGVLIVFMALQSAFPALSYFTNGYSLFGIVYMMTSKHYEVTDQVGVYQVIMGATAFLLLWPLLYLAVRK